ncbi:MAG TPA: hypothetical protein VKE69_08020 [Planctomycetota bacterium]|nr:hypothetical protein [Planctomycetota bacterium]
MTSLPFGWVGVLAYFFLIATLPVLLAYVAGCLLVKRRADKWTCALLALPFPAWCVMEYASESFGPAIGTRVRIKSLSNAAAEPLVLAVAGAIAVVVLLVLRRNDRISDAGARKAAAWVFPILGIATWLAVPTLRE